MTKKSVKTKPAARKAPAKKPAAKTTSAPKRPAATYTPQPVQSSGRAPFRYPPQ